MRLNYIDNIDCLEGMKQIPDGSVDMIRRAETMEDYFATVVW